MSTTYTTNTNLGKPALSDRDWSIPLNADFDAIDAFAAVGNLAVALHDVPSASLAVKVSAGVFRKSDGTLVSYAGTASQLMTTAATNYVYLTDSGTLTVSTSSFPASTFHVRLATVVAGATTITSITDSRIALVSGGANGNTLYLSLAGGTFADGAGVVTLTCGSTNGVKLGATGDKLGVLGATPIVRQTLGSFTFGATYTAAEQAKMQALYDAFRAFGYGT